MSGVSSSSPDGGGAGTLIAALVLLTLGGGCASLGIGQGQGSDGGDAPDAAGADTVARADTVSGDPDRAAAPGNAAGATLRDSVLAVLEARREAGDTAAAPDEDRSAEERAQQAAGEGGIPGAVRVTDVDSLRALGPVYTPYDVPPLLQRRGLEDLLRATVLPVVRRHDLEPDEWARFWVLVDEEGRVVDHRTHLGSGHGAFDEAAAAAARALRYRPARRDDEPVPVWVLVRISLLMDTG